MNRSEIKKAKDNELIMEYITTYSSAVLNINFKLPTKALDKHLKNLDDEMIKRGLLTSEQVKHLRG